LAEKNLLVHHQMQKNLRKRKFIRGGLSTKKLKDERITSPDLPGRWKEGTPSILSPTPSRWGGGAHLSFIRTEKEDVSLPRRKRTAEKTFFLGMTLLSSAKGVNRGGPPP